MLSKADRESLTALADTTRFLDRKFIRAGERFADVYAMAAAIRDHLGPANGAAVPGLGNQRRFLREFVTLAQQEGVEFYYFATFDELWKTEGGVGPYWGIFYPYGSSCS